MSVQVYSTKHRHNPQGNKLYSNGCDSLKTHKLNRGVHKLSKNWEPTQISRRHNGDLKQVSD